MAFRILALATASLTLFSSAANGQVFASFCNTFDCGDCGEGVDVSNPGCLNESGRQSILFEGTAVDPAGISLVFSPTPDCPCQNDCMQTIVPVAGAVSNCVPLIGTPDAQSFRFTEGLCTSNNC